MIIMMFRMVKLDRFIKDSFTTATNLCGTHQSLQIRYFTTVRKKFTINEDDIEESFARGAGPGGQKINKSMNKVRLVHIPTGIRVECQEQVTTRERPELSFTENIAYLYVVFFCNNLIYTEGFNFE